MKTTIWKSLTDREQEQIASSHEIKSKQIYGEDGKEQNPIPHAHCIVYCHGSNTHGWAEIRKPDDLGLEALIATSWILISDLTTLEHGR